MAQDRQRILQWVQEPITELGATGDCEGVGRADGKTLEGSGVKGSTVSAKRTEDGLSVTCGCGTTLGLPLEGGEDTCPCGMVHRYDGKMLVSTPKDAR